MRRRDKKGNHTRGKTKREVQRRGEGKESDKGGERCRRTGKTWRISAERGHDKGPHVKDGQKRPKRIEQKSDKHGANIIEAQKTTSRTARERRGRREQRERKQAPKQRTKTCKRGDQPGGAASTDTGSAAGKRTNREARRKGEEPRTMGARRRGRERKRSEEKDRTRRERGAGSSREAEGSAKARGARTATVQENAAGDHHGRQNANKPQVSRQVKLKRKRQNGRTTRSRIGKSRRKPRARNYKTRKRKSSTRTKAKRKREKRGGTRPYGVTPAQNRARRERRMQEPDPTKAAAGNGVILDTEGKA